MTFIACKIEIFIGLKVLSCVFLTQLADLKLCGHNKQSSVDSIRVGLIANMPVFTECQCCEAPLTDTHGPMCGNCILSANSQTQEAVTDESGAGTTSRDATPSQTPP